MVLLVPVHGPAKHGWGRFFRVPSVTEHCLLGANRSAVPVPTLLPNHTDETHHLVSKLYLNHNILR